jgi:hypothetical protein
MSGMQPCCELNCVMAMNIARLKRFFRALARERAEEVRRFSEPEADTKCCLRATCPGQGATKPNSDQFLRFAFGGIRR